MKATRTSRARLVAALVLATVALASCATSTGNGSSPTVDRGATGTEGETLREDLRVRPLADGVWLHVSTEEVEGFGAVPSNGLVVQGEGGVLLVDTPWTPAQTEVLLAWIDRSLDQPVLDVIVTHAHRDRTGGVAAIPPTARIHALSATAELSAAEGRPFTAETLPPTASLDLPAGRVETFFPRAGHTSDNIVVWLPAQRVLHGGCFVKEARSANLGNVADADLVSWGDAIQRVRTRYPEAEVVVPGHGAVGGTELLDRTQALLEEAITTEQQCGCRPARTGGAVHLARTEGTACSVRSLLRASYMQTNPDPTSVGEVRVSCSFAFLPQQSR